MSKITIYGIERYLNSLNKSMFDNVEFPNMINKDVLINQLMISSGEFECLFADPEFMIMAVTNWGVKHERTFNKWAEVLNLEYNPIENYDRYEEWVDGSSRNGTNTVNTSTNSSTESDSTGSTTDNGTTMVVRSAFDSQSYQPYTKDTINNTSSSQGHNESSDMLTSAVNGTNTESDNSTHTGHIHGNIGVMDSQTMVTKQLELVKWNLYQNIIDLFVDEFCVRIY